ncbi:MAG: hypothetical protein WCJ56_04860, partial [bacterium]
VRGNIMRRATLMAAMGANPCKQSSRASCYMGVWRWPCSVAGPSRPSPMNFDPDYKPRSRKPGSRPARRG